MEGTGYPQLSPVRIGRLGYLHRSPPYTLPSRQVPRQPAWFGRFPGNIGGTSLGSFRILLPQKEASITPATDHSAFRVPVSLHSAPCWRQPPSPGDCSDGKVREDAGIPAPGACRHASRPREKRFTPGCKKCEIKDEYGIRASPNHCAGFHRTVQGLQSFLLPVGGRCRKQESDSCESVLQQNCMNPRRIGYPQPSLFIRQLFCHNTLRTVRTCASFGLNLHSATGTHPASYTARYGVHWKPDWFVFPDQGPALWIPSSAVTGRGDPDSSSRPGGVNYSGGVDAAFSLRLLGTTRHLRTKCVHQEAHAS